VDVEKTMQFLMETAAQHDARLAEIEKNNVLIQRAVLGLTEHQSLMQTALEETQKLLRETQIETDRRFRETDRRITQLVSAVAKLAEQRPNASPRP
jgi:flagellar biosynthesis/type III secretory pathway protein FliH